MPGGSRLAPNARFKRPCNLHWANHRINEIGRAIEKEVRASGFSRDSRNSAATASDARFTKLHLCLTTMMALPTDVLLPVWC